MHLIRTNLLIFALISGIPYNSNAENIDLFSLISNIHGKSQIEKMASCLGEEPFELAASFQEALLFCGKGMLTSDVKDHFDSLEICARKRLANSKSIGTAEIKKCYPDNILENIANNELEAMAAADSLGALKAPQIFSLDRACKISMRSSEYLHLYEKEIFVKSGTVLPIVSAGGDSFEVLVGLSQQDIAEGPIEYITENCPREFIEAISAYSLKDNSEYDAEEVVTKDLKITTEPSTGDVICELKKGDSLEDAIFTFHETHEEPVLDSVSLTEIEFHPESKICPGTRGYIDTSFIVSFVVKPDIGFLNNEAELPICSEKTNGLSAFVSVTLKGPDLLRCNFSKVDGKGLWEGKYLP